MNPEAAGAGSGAPDGRRAVFSRTIRLPHPAAEVFAWHAREGAFERLRPPWEKVEVLARTGGIEDGARIVLRIRHGVISFNWKLTHQGHVAGRRFQDHQTSGPFAFWEHTHDMSPDPHAPEGSILEDRIEYELPLGSLGHALGGAMVRRRLDRLFTYRHGVTAGDLAAHQSARRHRQSGGGNPLMRILVSGSRGLIGSSLVAYLQAGGHEVIRLARSGGTEEGVVRWNPLEGQVDAADLEGFDAVVHLAGETVQGRWSPPKKAAIRESRVRGTDFLVDTLSRLRRKPEVLVCASASGYYGDRGDEPLTEASPPGRGFLAAVGEEWETAAYQASSLGIRTVMLRQPMVLTPAGGALARLLQPFHLGVGGPLGSGHQWWSWVGLDDLLDIYLAALSRSDLQGPINASAPAPVTNRGFTRILAGVLGRPAFVPVPSFALRLLLGEMADEMLLASARIVPRRLEEIGFRFRHPTLEEALRHLLARALG